MDKQKAPTAQLVVSKMGFFWKKSWWIVDGENTQRIQAAAKDQQTG